MVVGSSRELTSYHGGIGRIHSRPEFLCVRGSGTTSGRKKKRPEEWGGILHFRGETDWNLCGRLEYRSQEGQRCQEEGREDVRQTYLRDTGLKKINLSLTNNECRDWNLHGKGWRFPYDPPDKWDWTIYTVRVSRVKVYVPVYVGYRSVRFEWTQVMIRSIIQGSPPPKKSTSTVPDVEKVLGHNTKRVTYTWMMTVGVPLTSKVSGAPSLRRWCLTWMTSRERTGFLDKDRRVPDSVDYIFHSRGLGFPG